MYDYKTEARVESKLVPGVTFVINAPSYGRRLNLDRATAEFRSATRLIQRRYNKVVEQLQAMEREHVAAEKARIKRESPEGGYPADTEPKPQPFPMPQDMQDTLDEINEESLHLLASRYNVPRVRIYVKAIEGLEIDGVPATVDSFIASGDPTLFSESLAAIETVEQQKADELKNLSSPSISSNPAVGETKDMIATPAASEVITKVETA